MGAGRPVIETGEEVLATEVWLPLAVPHGDSDLSESYTLPNL